MTSRISVLASLSGDTFSNSACRALFFERRRSSGKQNVTLSNRTHYVYLQCSFRATISAVSSRSTSPSESNFDLKQKVKPAVHNPFSKSYILTARFSASSSDAIYDRAQTFYCSTWTLQYTGYLLAYHVPARHTNYTHARYTA